MIKRCLNFVQLLSVPQGGVNLSGPLTLCLHYPSLKEGQHFYQLVWDLGPQKIMFGVK